MEWNRRDFIGGLFTMGLINAGMASAENVPRIDPHMFHVIARTVIDTERLVYAQGGVKITYEQQLAYYKKAAKAIKDGLDPYDPNFWDKVGTIRDEVEKNSSMASLVENTKV